MALLIAVILMLLISAIGLGALQSATGESSAGGRSARKLRTFFAADAGMEMVLRQLDTTQNQYPDISALDEQQFMQNQYGGFTQVRTGTADNDAPQDIRRVGRSRQEGGALNVNSANTYTFGIYRADVVATDPAGGRVELQAQLSVSEGSDNYK
ncbi:MAG: pilus assembly PilX N-terminal domain-containing protein [Myxococcota bacterium]